MYAGPDCPYCERLNEYYYRYDDLQDSDNGTRVFLSKFVVRKQTVKGVWIGYDLFGKGRFVLNDSRKRYACPTIEEAKQSFIIRKRRQVGILKSQLARAETALEIIEEGKVDKSGLFVI